MQTRLSPEQQEIANKVLEYFGVSSENFPNDKAGLEALLQQKMPEIINTCETDANWTYFSGDIRGIYNQSYQSGDKDHQICLSIFKLCYSGVLSLDFFKTLLNGLRQEDQWRWITYGYEASVNPVGMAVMTGNLALLQFLDEIYKQNPKKNIYAMMNEVNADLEVFFQDNKCDPAVKAYYDEMVKRYIKEDDEYDEDDILLNNKNATLGNVEEKHEITAESQIIKMGVDNDEFMQLVSNENKYRACQGLRYSNLSIDLQGILKKNPDGLSDLFRFGQQIFAKCTNDNQELIQDMIFSALVFLDRLDSKNFTHKSSEFMKNMEHFSKVYPINSDEFSKFKDIVNTIINHQLENGPFCFIPDKQKLEIENNIIKKWFTNMQESWEKKHPNNRLPPDKSLPHHHALQSNQILSFEDAIKELEDYCLPRAAYSMYCGSGSPETGLYGGFFRLFTGRWNRHHIQAVSEVLAQHHNGQINNINELATALNNTFANANINPHGDLAKIMEKLPQPPDSFTIQGIS